MMFQRKDYRETRMPEDYNGDRQKKGEDKTLILGIAVFYIIVLVALSFPPVSEFSVNASLLK